MSEQQYSDNKHPSGRILLLRIIFASVLTAAALLIGQNLFLKVQPEIRVCFDLRYENYRRNHFQLFFRNTQNQKVNILPTIYLKGQPDIRIDAVIPEQSLSMIRLDFGSSPGAVVCRNFVIKGKKDISMKDMQVRFSNQLKNLKLEPDGLSCSSSGNDPFISFQLKKPLKAQKTCLFDFWSFWIILVSAFILSFALSGIFSGRKPEERNWLYWADGGLVLLFAAALLVPMSHMDKIQISLTEKRKLAEYQPLITPEGKINYHYGKAFDAWFNDHFFGRSVLLDFNAFLFIMTKSPLQAYGRVYCGFDNWYFYSLDNALRNYHNLDLFTEKQLAQAADDLKKIQELCNRKNKKLYLVLVPDKHKVYGEYFPGAPKIRPDSESRARQFERYVNSKVPGIRILPLLDTLLENKHKGLLYWKNSTHWNEMGAYVGYLGLMKFIRKDFPDVPMCDIQPVKLEKSTLRGDLNAFSNGRKVPDLTLYPLPHFVKKYKVQGDGIGKSFGTSKTINPSGKYKVLILRDSFSSSLLPYMANSFQQINALWNIYQIPRDKLNMFQEADIIIFECVERFLPVMLKNLHTTRINLEGGVR